MKRLLMAALLFSLSAPAVFAQELSASLPVIPPLVESKDKGILVDLVKAISEETSGKIAIAVYPFPRAIQNIEEGTADFEMPLLVNPLAKESDLKFRYSTVKLFDVVFALYTNKNNSDINPSNLSKYKIETDSGHVGFFNFKVSGNTSIESGLQKVAMGRIDGWIFAMPESDTVLKKLDSKDIKRWEYKKFEVRAILPKGPKGDKADKILADAIAKLKKEGKYEKIMGPLLNMKFEESK